MCGNCWRIIEKVPPSTITFIPGEGIQPGDIGRIEEITGGQTHVVMRPYFAPSADYTARLNYLRAVASLLRSRAFDDVIPEGYRHLQLWNEPNMPTWSQWEGFGPEAFGDFNDWFLTGYDMMKASNPSWKVGFTPLTIGNRDVWFPNDQQGVPYWMHGPEAAREDATPADVQAAIRNGPCFEALSQADEYYAHIYCQNDPPNEIYALWYGLRFLKYAQFFPKPMDIWLTENGIGGQAENWATWYTLLDNYPEVKGTAIWWLHHIFDNPDARAINVLHDYIEAYQEPGEPEEPEAVDIEEIIRNAAWNACGVPYNSDAAFPFYARANDLGVPQTPEQDIVIGATLYRYQGFSGGVVYAPVGRWDQTTHVEW